jgi:pimeloyl-ACP methyl ester carboxylesterase
MNVKSDTVTTNDGVRLHYLEAGEGSPLFIVPAFAAPAEIFKYQLEALSNRYRVIALDHRGHGESEKPDHGYKIARLATDVRDALKALHLNNATLLGHSMGCCVIWSYLELFGDERLAKLILVDEPAFAISNPAWSQEELDAAGAVTTPQAVIEAVNALNGPNFEAVMRGFLDPMFTATIDAEVKEWFIQECLKTTHRHAGDLVYNHLNQDWRDVIRRIVLPTLIIGGRVSHIPWKSQVWIHEQIPGSELEIFEADEGGAHFMFLENPDRFNRIVAKFLG